MNEPMEILRMHRQEQERLWQDSFLTADAIALGFRQEDPVRLYLAQIGHLEILPEAEEQQLANRAVRGEEAARERLLDHNRLRVAAIAREYVYRGMNGLDLLREGNEALENAVRRYDPESIYPFGAYASWQIRRAMANALKNYTCLTRVPERPITVPAPVDPDLVRNPAMLRWLLERHIGRAISEQDWMILAARFCPWGHRPLTLEELGAMMGIPRNDIRLAEYRIVRGRHIRRAKKIRDFYA